MATDQSTKDPIADRIGKGLAILAACVVASAIFAAVLIFGIKALGSLG